METSLIILVQLLLGHVFADFVLQTNAMVKHKRKHKATSWYLYVHVALASLLSYVFVMQWERFEIIFIIFVTHLLIDIWKLNTGKDNLTLFLIDQFLHLIVLVAIWLYLIDGYDQVGYFLNEMLNSPRLLSTVVAYIIVIYPIGFIVGKATEKWNKEITKQFKDESLKNAGRYIGIFERILVLTFIITGNFGAIGFLIGAKSILRFSDTKGTRKQTEYVLIGTLMSFSLCILVGLIVRTMW